MRSAEEILKKFEDDRLCGFEEFDRKEIIKMMNEYAKDAFKASKETKKRNFHGVLKYEQKYYNFDEWLKSTEEPKRIISELDPYGEENWDEKENTCTNSETPLKPYLNLPDDWYVDINKDRFIRTDSYIDDLEKMFDNI